MNQNQFLWGLTCVLEVNVLKYKKKGIDVCIQVNFNDIFKTIVFDIIYKCLKGGMLIFFNDRRTSIS